MNLRFRTIPRVSYMCEFYMLLTLALTFNSAVPPSLARAQDRGTIYTGEPHLVSGYERFSDATARRCSTRAAAWCS